MIELKWCPQCDDDLPITEFYRSAKNPELRDSWCKTCKCAAERRRYALRKARREALARLARERYDVFTPFVVISGPDNQLVLPL